MKALDAHNQKYIKVDRVLLESVNVALNGLPKSWEPFFKGVCAQENFPDW
jgi:hypothetical protein